MKTFRAVRDNLMAVILLTALMLMGFIAANSMQSYAASPSEVKKGDLIEIGRADVDGYTGMPRWRVLDIDDEDGSMFLLSEYLWKGNGENSDKGVCFIEDNNTKEIYDQVLYWRGTDAEIWSDHFEAAILSDIKGFRIKPIRRDDKEYYYTQSLYGKENNKELHFDAANAILYENHVFFLSAEEVDNYFPDPHDRVAYLPGSTTPEQWLMRSSQAVSNWASEVKADGELTAVTARTGRAARPAFWMTFDNDTSLEMAEEDDVRVWTISEDNNTEDQPSTEPGNDDPKDQDDPGKTDDSGKEDTKPSADSGKEDTKPAADPVKEETKPGKSDAAKTSIAKAKITVKPATYTGKALKPAVTVRLGGKTLKKDTDYTVKYANNKKAGKATVTVKGKGSYKGTKKKAFTIAKANQPMKVKAKKIRNFKAKALRKKAQTVKKAKAYKFTKKAKGKVTYKLSKVNKTKFKKYFKINKKNGNITLKKGLKKGTYKLTVKVKAKGNANYESATRTVKLVIKVK